jgi:recombinational DNA repair ATPase RecF
VQHKEALAAAAATHAQALEQQRQQLLRQVQEEVQRAALQQQSYEEQLATLRAQLTQRLEAAAAAAAAAQAQALEQQQVRYEAQLATLQSGSKKAEGVLQTQVRGVAAAQGDRGCCGAEAWGQVDTLDKGKHPGQTRLALATVLYV